MIKFIDNILNKILDRYVGENKKKTIIQFLKFAIVGASNTAISLTIYYVFVLINEKLYLIGNGVGFVISVLNAYYWSSKYVFKKDQTTKKDTKNTLIKTYISYGSTFLLSMVLIYIMVDKIGISEFLAPIINMCVTVPLNFVLNKYWTFK